MNKVQAGQTNWVEFYRAALLETDQAKLRDRIVAAQKALRERVSELKEDGEGSAQEIRALEDALKALRSLLELYVNP
jgi:predicted  nucleic acid-binding Zn-ribbon protein